MKRALILACALVGGVASAQTYQVGQFLGNLNEAGRFAWGTMGAATSHIPHSGPATWTTLQPGILKHTAQATATIGGRTVPLTLISRVPVAGIAQAARGVALLSPASAAVTLLGFAAMQGWLTPAGLEWNSDPATNVAQPFLMWKPVSGAGGCDISPAMQANWSNWVANTTPFNCASYPNPAVLSTSVAAVKDGQTPGMCMLGRQTTCMSYTEFVNYAEVPLKSQSAIQKTPATWDEAMPQLTNTQHDMSAVDWKSIAEGLLQRGANLPQPTNQELSGPAQQPGPKTTKQNADGTTTTTNTTNHYNYAGNTITITNVTSSNVTNNAGDTVSSETETKEGEEEEAATDSPLPGMPELYKRKYPNGMKGVWDEKIAVIKTSSLFAIVPGLTPNLGDGGCPVWMFQLNVGLYDFGQFDISLPCALWAFLRICIIVTALFLARKLIFGG